MTVVHGEELSIKHTHARGIVAFAVFSTFCWMAILNWDGSMGEVSASLLHWRLFVISCLFSVFVHLMFWVLAPSWRSMGDRPIWIMVVVTSLLLGLAVGTTDWEAWTISGWWQFWWTAPLVAASIGLIKRIHQSTSSNADLPGGDDGRTRSTSSEKPGVQPVNLA